MSSLPKMKWARILAGHLNWKNLLTFGWLVNWELRRCELSSCHSSNDTLTSGRSLPAPGTLLRYVESCWPYTSKKPGPDNETSFLQDVAVDPSACSSLLSKSHNSHLLLAAPGRLNVHSHFFDCVAWVKLVADWPQSLMRLDFSFLVSSIRWASP